MARNPEAQTAFGPIVLSAIEHNEPPGRRLVDDDLAASFLPTALRTFTRATRFTPLRRAVVAASERTGPGLWANLSCRKHYIDDNLADALSTVDAVVILGAGLDTRPYRLAQHSDVPVFEVDQQANIARKRAIVAKVFGTAPPSVRLVPMDFEHDDLMSTLVAHGYRADARTFFVWEGVTQYLTADAVRATFDQLSAAAPGSKLDFTYVRGDFIDGENLYGAPVLYRRMRQRTQVWKSGLLPEDVEGFLAGHGWRLIEQLGPDEVINRYVQPAGRNLPASQIEWSAYAAKT
jgi:methyltransferase (TIGR00027 family)